MVTTQAYESTAKVSEVVYCEKKRSICRIQEVIIGVMYVLDIFSIREYLKMDLDAYVQQGFVELLSCRFYQLITIEKSEKIACFYRLVKS